MSQPEIEKALRDSFSGSWGGASSNKVRVKKVLFGDNQIAVLLQVEGDVCGSVWAWGHLGYQAAGNRLVFELAGHSNTAATEERSAPLLNHLRTRGQVPLAGSSWVNAKRAEQLIDEVRGTLPSELKVEVEKLEIPQAEVQASQDGYTVLHQVTARLMINDVSFRR